MKPKTAFESGNSPPKVSENGAAIQTGRGLEQVLRGIEEAFNQIRRQEGPVQGPEEPQAPQVQYTEHHRAKFHERAKRLSLAALESSCIMKATRSNVWIISAPTQTPEELYNEAAEVRAEYREKILAARRDKKA